jgi:surface carbohydrate biosynthesis protein
MKSKKWLYLPVDVKVRELEGKTLLACHAVKSGYNVVLGSHTYLTLNMDKFPSGIFFDKIATAGRKELFQNLKRMGHKVVTLDEEGLVYLKAFYTKNRVSEETLLMTDIFFAWGNKQTNDIISTAPTVKDKVLTVGNPRFDLLRKDYRGIFEGKKRDINKRFGKFILINTNFGMINSMFGDQSFLISRFKEMKKITSKDEEERYLKFFDHRLKIFERFKEMIPEISRNFSHYNIIVRPHPAENHSFWKDFTALLNNVHVVHEGSAIPWILASEIVVHSGCTTGIESYLLDVPVVVFRPVISDDYDLLLPIALSKEAHDIAELTSCLDQIISCREEYLQGQDDQRKNMANEYVDSISGSFASEKMMAAINGLEISPAAFSFKNHLKINWTKHITNLKERIKPFIVEKGLKGDYSKQVNSGISIHEIQDIVHLIQDVDNSLPDIKVKPLGFNCCMLY